MKVRVLMQADIELPDAVGESLPMPGHESYELLRLIYELFADRVERGDCLYLRSDVWPT